MASVLPIVLWYGGLLGAALAAVFVGWALVQYATRESAGGPVALLLAGLALALGSSSALVRGTSLNHENQLRAVHAPLIRLAANGVSARAALDDVRSAAEPSADLAALLSKFDQHERSIDALLEAEWQYQRTAVWNEPALLHEITWALNDVLVHHARWENVGTALECPQNHAAPSLDESIQTLHGRLQEQATLAAAMGEQFEGFDFQAGGRDATSDTLVVRVVAIVMAALALLAIGVFLYVRRTRPPGAVDIVVAGVAVGLGALGVWLAAGSGNEPERRREDLFARTVAVHRESTDLRESASALALMPRGVVVPPRVTREQVIGDYVQYKNALVAATQLVRTWDRLVLTGRLEPEIGWSDRIRTHDELLQHVRSQLLAVYRQYLAIDRKISALNCRSEWFPRDPSQTREDRLVALAAR